MTERIARACAAHPGRTFAAWGLTLLASVLCIAFLLRGLTTDALLTNNPQSDRALGVLERAFPPDPERAVTDLMVVRSEELTVDDPRFRSFVEQVVGELRESEAVAPVRTYWESRRGDQSPQQSLISGDGHATLVPLAVLGEEAAGDVVEVVEASDDDPAFEVAVAGNETLDHDFNLLSERDLQEGELQFGLPAALIILLLVFGTVVAGVVPLLMPSMMKLLGDWNWYLPTWLSWLPDLHVEGARAR